MHRPHLRPHSKDSFTVKFLIDRSKSTKSTFGNDFLKTKCYIYLFKVDHSESKQKRRTPKRNRPKNPSIMQLLQTRRHLSLQRRRVPHGQLVNALSEGKKDKKGPWHYGHHGSRNQIVTLYNSTSSLLVQEISSAVEDCN